MENRKMLVYSQQDMQTVLEFVDRLQFAGVSTARKVGLIATILESGRPLENYLKKEEGGDSGIR